MFNLNDKIKKNSDEYNFDQVDCFEKVFGIVLDGYHEGYSNIFYMYMKLCRAYNVVDFNNIDDFVYIIETIKKIISDKFGLKVEEHILSDDKYFTFIKDKLDKNYAVMIPGNQGELYYSPYYKKMDFAHLFVIKGYDHERQLYLILDNLHINPDLGEYYDFVIQYETLKKINKAYFNDGNDNGIAYYINERESKLRNRYDIFLNCINMYLDDLEKQPYKEIEYINSLLNEIKSYCNNNSKDKNNISSSVNYRGKTFNIEDFNNIVINTSKFKHVFLNELVNIASNYIEDKEILNEVSELRNKIVNKWNAITNRVIINFYKCKVFDVSELIDEVIYYEEICKEKVRYIKELILVQKYLYSSNNYKKITNNTQLNAESETEEKIIKIWKEVLDVEEVNVEDNFFEIGGNSLKAMILISKIHRETNKEISLKELFNSPTIRGVSEFIDNANENHYSNIDKVKEKEYYEASSAQKRMYVIQGFEKDSIAYNMPQIFEIQVSMDKNKIEDIFRKLVLRHEALRTSFETVEGEIVQKIDSQCKFSLKSRVKIKSIEKVVNDFVKPFELGRAPLFRAEIVETQEKTYLLIDMHHIISDGVSMSILINEFASLYNGEDLEPLKLQYKDFAAWQNNFLKSKDMKKQEEYWINMFNDDIPVLNLPYDYERPAIQSFEGDSVSFEVDKNIARELKNLTKKTGTTMHMVLLSAFNILLYKYSGQQDIVIGIPIAGRSHADLQNIIGMFVNTLALRNKLTQHKKYIDFLIEVKENSLKAYENQSYQIETLVEKLNLRRDSSRSLLFDVMFNTFNIENYEVELDNLLLKSYSYEDKAAKFDLTLSLFEVDDKLELNLTYCKKLFTKETIEVMRDDFIDILQTISEDNNVLLGNVVNKEVKQGFNDDIQFDGLYDDFLLD